MARVAILTCPACGQSGPADRSETAFDYIARDGLIELRRCRGCRAPLLVRFALFPTRAMAEVIPAEVWEEMERVRDDLPADPRAPAYERAVRLRSGPELPGGVQVSRQ
jgi:hypothetical protein